MRHINKIILSLVLLSFLPNSIVFSQEDVDINKSEFKTENSLGLKEAWDAVKIGDDYYNMGGGSLREARKHYIFAYKYNPSNPQLNYKIGMCYLLVDDKYEAIKYLRKAYELDHQVSTDIHYVLARAHHLALEFDRAVMEYETYRNNLTEKQKKKGLYVDVDKYIDECHNGKELIANPLRVIINNLGSGINSEADEYNSVLSPLDTLMYFSSRRKLDKKSEITLKDNKFFENIYFSRKFGKEWQLAESAGEIINERDRHNAILAVSPDMQSIYTYDGRSGGGDIMVSIVKKGKRKKPKLFDKNISSKYSETAMCFSPSGDTLYLVSSRLEGSFGGRDIYYSFLWGKPGKKKKWQTPVNLGSIVNSPHNEESVFMHPDGKTLFFSSKGHNTMGGYDIFKTVRDEQGEWSDPENLGYPINKADDELFYISSENGKYGYYSALRDGGIGGKDIYKIMYLGEEKEMLLSNEDILVAGILDEEYHIFFRDPLQLHIDTMLIMKGLITNKKTGEPVKAKLELIDSEKSSIIATAISNDKGEYKITLKEKKMYGVEIVSKDFLVYIDIVDISSEPSNELVIVNFELEKVEVGEKIVLENIYFETSKSTLKPESYPELDKMVTFMEQNENMRVEISGHTDNVGALKFNQKLSEGRAKSVVDYLVGHGINKARLEYMGYAFTQPIAPNDTENGRAQNRRVEFKVLSLE